MIDTEIFPVQNGNHAGSLLLELNTINIPPVDNLPALPNRFGNLPSHLHSVSIPNLNPINDNHVARDKHGSPRVSLHPYTPKWTRTDRQSQLTTTLSYQTSACRFQGIRIMIFLKWWRLIIASPITMNFLVWNFRRLWNLCTRKELGEIV